jgi:hypothetical protein
MSDAIPELVSRLMIGDRQMQSGAANPLPVDTIAIAHRISWSLVVIPGREARAALYAIERLKTAFVMSTGGTQPIPEPNRAAVADAMGAARTALESLQRSLAHKLRAPHRAVLPSP